MSRSATHWVNGRRGPMRALLVGVCAVAMVGVTALPAAAATPTNIRVNPTAAAPQTYYKSSSMSKSPASDSVMAIAYAQDKDLPTAQSGLQTCYLATTANGGTTWTEHAVVGTATNPLPNPPGIAGSDKVRCQSPGVAYNAAGTSLVYVFQVPIFHNGTGGRFDFGFTYATKSTDGGVTWSAPLLVSDPGYVVGTYDVGGDWYPSVSVDTVSTAAKDSIYVTWVRYGQAFNTKNVLLKKSSFATFTFGAANVQVNSTVTSPNHGIVANEGGGGAPSAVTEAGKVCVTWEDLTQTDIDVGITAPKALASCATTAGGTTFGTPATLGNVVPTMTPKSCPDYGTNFRCGDIQASFSIAAGPCPTQTCTNGQVQVAWTDTINGRIWLATSSTGGTGFGTAVQTAQVASGHQQYAPWLSINRTDGRLDLSDYDLDPTGTCLVASHGSRNTYHVKSLTLGADLTTKAPAVVSDHCSDQAIFPDATGFFPSHDGRVVSASTNSTTSGTVVGWTDTRNSTNETTGRTWDIYSGQCVAANCLT